MTTSEITSTVLNNSDAAFRAWAKQLSNQIKAVGVVQTADTGQIDLNTALRPAAGGVAGSEMFRFPDSDPLQATSPIFFQVSYGSSPNSQIHPAVYVTVGSGSTGANALTGLKMAALLVQRAMTVSDIASPTYVCFKPEIGYLGVAGWVGSNQSTPPSSALVFSISRPCDDAGAPVADAVVLHSMNGTAMYQAVMSRLTNSTLYTNQRGFSCLPSGATLMTTAVGPEISLLRHYCATPRLRNIPGQLSYLRNDLGAGAPIVVPVLGANRTYMPLGNGMNNCDASGHEAACLAMLWE